MRKHLTTLRWYEDRLCSLSSTCLLALSLVCLAALGVAGGVLRQFLDDAPFLLSEGDFKAILISFDLVLLTSAALWLLSCSLGALCRRLVLRIKGL